MRISPAQAFVELYRALISDGPLDEPSCRRLTLRITSEIPDPDAAGFIHELICGIIDAHARDPREARDRLDRIRPVIKQLTTPN